MSQYGLAALHVNRHGRLIRRYFAGTFYILKMGYPSVFQLLSRVFAKAKVRSALIGGFAVNFYKVSRQTADIDFIIKKEDFEKIAPLLEEAGYSASRYDLFARCTNHTLDRMDIDFLFVDETTLHRIIDEGKAVKIAHREFIVPSLQHLIALKLHALKYRASSGNNDLLDIVRLIGENGINYDDADFKALCLRYGSESIYEKIQFLKRSA